MAKAARQSAPRGTASQLFATRGVLELLLAAAAFIVYAGTLVFGFVYDDRAQVLGNKIITDWSYVPGYFTQHIWALIDPQVTPNYYRPVFLLWLKINYSLFDFSPAWWHMSAIALHIVATVQVFWLGKRLLRHRLAAATAALIFAVHPVHVESVAWVSGVTDPLLCVMMLAAVLCYLRWQQTRSTFAYVSAACFAAAAFLSKEPSVALPVVLAITAWSVRDREKPFEWKPILPFFALALVYLALRQYILHGFAHEMSNATVREMVLTWPAVIVFYLRQMFFPYQLSLFHSLPWVESASSARFIVPLVITLAVVTALALFVARGSERAARIAAVAWLAIPLVPMMYLRVYMEGEIVHDRYTYVSTVGFSFLLVMIGMWLLEYVPSNRRSTTATAVLAAFVVVFGALTFYNQSDWASDLLLFTHALKIAPDSNAAKLDLGTVYAEKGDRESVAVGKRFFEEVTRSNPKNAAAWFDLGHAEYNQGDYINAEMHTWKALQMDAKFAPWWMHFAGIELRLGKFYEAEGAAQEALNISPEEPGYHAALGAIYLGWQKWGQAEQEFKAELKLHPDNPSAKQGLASIAAMQAGVAPPTVTSPR